MKLTKLRTITSVLTVAAVAGVVALAIPATGAENRYITVTGVGTISVVPDAVRFNATVSTVGTTNAEALSSAVKSAAALRRVLKDIGIATNDIRSTNISVFPEYNWAQETGTKITGYRASQSFDVLVRTASKAGIIIEAVVTTVGNNIQIGGIIPTILNPSLATKDARTAAVSNAKSKATSYAKLLGTSIGKVLSLEEQSSPVYSSAVPISKVGSADAVAVEIDLGEQDVTVIITVRWALK